MSNISNKPNNLLRPPSSGYHAYIQAAIDRSRTTDNMNSGKSCGSCRYFTQSCKCKMKGNKQVKSYNICQYHDMQQQA